ncbi:unnamed protein product [Pleuronectes platessa]|uniref:Uncharacterized protein n=1 Tax=Pleuronectes platessa TaxID=8262 RepID=A0A9N7VP65_PLEPL|nr:unnamed protein product [Pleuronectes platessa]
MAGVWVGDASIGITTDGQPLQAAVMWSSSSGVNTSELELETSYMTFVLRIILHHQCTASPLLPHPHASPSTITQPLPSLLMRKASRHDAAPHGCGMEPRKTGTERRGGVQKIPTVPVTRNQGSQLSRNHGNPLCTPLLVLVSFQRRAVMKSSPSDVCSSEAAGRVGQAAEQAKASPLQTAEVLAVCGGALSEEASWRTITRRIYELRGGGGGDEERSPRLGRLLRGVRSEGLTADEQASGVEVMQGVEVVDECPLTPDTASLFSPLEPNVW